MQQVWINKAQIGICITVSKTTYGFKQEKKMGIFLKFLKRKRASP